MIALGVALLTGVAAAMTVGVATAALPLQPVRRRRPQVAVRQTWLIQAGTDLTPSQFWGGSLLAGVVTMLVLLAATSTPAVAIVPAVGVGLLPHLFFARRRSRRLRAVQTAWPDGLRDLVAAIAAGLSLHQALCALASSGPDPLRRAFARYPVLARTLGVVAALEVIKEELADPTSDRVLEVLVLAHERGGAIVTDILRDLAEVTTQDVRTLEEVTTAALEQRINARAVFVLPWLVLLLLTARDGFFRDFYRSAAGVFVVVVAGLLSLFGAWLVSRLGRDPVENRVLGGAAAAPPPPPATPEVG